MKAIPDLFSQMALMLVKLRMTEVAVRHDEIQCPCRVLSNDLSNKCMQQ